MKRIKGFSKSFIFLSVLYVAIGIVLLAVPSLSTRAMGKGLGVLMLAVGATYGIVYFTRSAKKEGFLQLDLVIGIVCLAFGIFLLLTPEFMGMVLPFAVATILLIGAIVKLQSAFQMKDLLVRRWYIGLIGAITIIALGLVLLCFPFATEQQMLIYIGVALILDGLTNLMGLICIFLRSGKLRRMQEQYPEADLALLVRKEWEEAEAEKAAKKAAREEKKQEAQS